MEIPQPYLQAFSSTLTAFLGSGLALALVGFWVNRKLESYKHELNRTAKRQEIAFSELHQTRAKVIAQLYANLIELRLGLDDLNRSRREGEFSPEFSPELLDKNSELFKWASQHGIYFSDSLNRLILDIHQNLGFEIMGIKLLTDDEIMNQYQCIDPLLDQLRSEFKKLLSAE